MPSIASSSILLDAAPYAYTGQRVTLTIDATRSGSAGDPPLPVSATVDFGDGSSGATTACGAPAAVEHVYTYAGHYQPRVTAATTCDPPAPADISFSTTPLIVFPSAPAKSADWPMCTTYQIQIRGHSLGGGMGESEDVVSLENVSSTNCQLDGDPGLQLVAAGGRLLPTKVIVPSDGSLSFPASVPHRVALVPGGVSSFDLDYNLNPANNEPDAVACPSAATVRVTLPGSDQYGTVTLAMAPCYGVVRVSSLVPGATGFRF